MMNEDGVGDEKAWLTSSDDEVDESPFEPAAAQEVIARDKKKAEPLFWPAPLLLLPPASIQIARINPFRYID